MEVGGFDLRVHVSGRGPDVLLLHGFPETLQAWSGHAPILAGHWRVHAFDWPGLGASGAPRGQAYSFERYGRLIGEYLDRAAIQGAHLVATDIAVPPAFLFSLDAPSRVRSLTVFDGPALDRPRCHSWEIHALKRWPLGELMVYGFPRTMFWIAMQRGFFGEPSFAPDVWEDFHAQVRRPRTREVALELFRSGRPALARIERGLGRLSPPLSILWGEEDVFDRVALAHELKAKCPAASLHVAPHCGHFLAQEAAEFFIDRLTDFLVAVDCG
jgi:pimeloyl-ACP methyl ester carboxylesterase